MVFACGAANGGLPAGYATRMGMLQPDETYRIAYVVRSDPLALSDLEDPELLAVHRYWDTVREGRVGPPVGRFRLEELPPAVIPAVAVVDFLGPPLDYYYRFFGTRMVEIAGQDLTGKRYFADDVTGYGFVNAQIFPKMIERRQPVLTRTEWVAVNGREITTVTVRLPLSEDGEAVTGGVTANRYYRGHDGNGEILN